jgi:hypothetical protein
VLRDRDAALTGQLPGNALGVDPPRAGGARGREQVARTLAAHPVVARTQRGDLVGFVGQIGQLMHHRVGPEAGYRVVQRGGGIDIADDWLATEPAQRIGFPRRARHAGDIMPGRDQQGHQPHTDHALAPATKIRTEPRLPSSHVSESQLQLGALDPQKKGAQGVPYDSSWRLETWR